MNRKAMIAAARKAGWKGKGRDSLLAWAEEQGVNAIRVGDTDFPLEGDGFDDIWSKTVTISVSADAGEDVVVSDDSPAETEEADETEAEDKMGGEDEEDEVSKSVKAGAERRRQRNKGLNPYAMHATKGPAVRTSGIARRKKAYDRAVRDGTEFMGKRPVFQSADESEFVGAAIRLMATKNGLRAPYQKIEDDRAIVKATGLTTTNEWGGALVIDEVAPGIIDLLHKYGATRQLAGVEPMRNDVKEFKKRGSEMSFAYTSEGAAGSETNPEFETISLNAKKIMGIARLSNEILEDDAFGIGDQVAISTANGMAKFEDEDYFLGSYGTHGGLAGAIDSDSTYDATLSASGWEGYTVPKIQQWFGKVPAEAWASGTVALACSSAFYFSVLRSQALSAGGTSGDSILSGIKGGYAYDHVPVVLTEVLPSTYAADQIVAYLGSFKRGTYFGEVTGSHQLDASSERYWDEDEFAWRAKERIAFNFHGVGGTDSEVIALKD